MITAIKNINYSNSYRVNNTSRNYTKTPNLQTDTVSFTANTSTLSKKSIDVIEEFANKLELNKIYKFNKPKAGKFQLASFSSIDDPQKRSLIIIYKEYPGNNMLKQLNFTVSDSGEIFENGVPVKKRDEIHFYDNIIPEIINQASKELKNI